LIGQDRAATLAGAPDDQLFHTLSESLMKIAFLGLGAMGSRMAANLAKAGFDLTVWNRSGVSSQELLALGAHVAATPRQAAEQSDIVFSMVTDDDAARAVWLDPNNGAALGLKSGAIAVESSTVTPAWALELGSALETRSVSVLDAPVAGSRPQAEAGQLIFMIGGDADTLERVRPALAILASSCIHVGGVGQGAVLKLAVNALFAAQLQSVAELLGFLSHNGFAAEQAAELLGRFPIVAPPIAAAARMMASKSTAALFTIDLIEKDLGYILRTAADSGAELPGAEAAHAIFRKAQAKGFGQSNVSGLAALFA
jgi:3-hydroxyisobutyrate dehydrogenase-like beta-hydroxyacid dehydrogenase